MHRIHIVGSIGPMNSVDINEVEQIRAVEGIADGDSQQPRSALGPLSLWIETIQAVNKPLAIRI
jgi:hypothetical protein